MPAIIRGEPWMYVSTILLSLMLGRRCAMTGEIMNTREPYYKKISTPTSLLVIFQRSFVSSLPMVVPTLVSFSSFYYSSLA